MKPNLKYLKIVDTMRGPDHAWLIFNAHIITAGIVHMKEKLILAQFKQLVAFG